MPYEPPSLESREQHVAQGPRHEQWLEKRDAGEGEAWRNEQQAASNLEHWIKASINLAVRLYESPTEVRAYLEARRVHERIDELATLWPRLRRQTFTGTDPGLAYSLWLLDRGDHIPTLLEYTSEIVSKSAISRFWDDHHRAIDSLWRNTSYRRNLPPKTYVAWALIERQLAVIEAVTNGEDANERYAAAESEFGRANRDKRLLINAVVTINPSGLDPVRFDLALWAIREVSASRST